MTILDQQDLVRPSVLRDCVSVFVFFLLVVVKESSSDSPGIDPSDELLSSDVSVRLYCLNQRPWCVLVAPDRAPCLLSCWELSSMPNTTDHKQTHGHNADAK